MTPETAALVLAGSDANGERYVTELEIDGVAVSVEELRAARTVLDGLMCVAQNVVQPNPGANAKEREGIMVERLSELDNYLRDHPPRDALRLLPGETFIVFRASRELANRLRGLSENPELFQVKAGEKLVVFHASDQETEALYQHALNTLVKEPGVTPLVTVLKRIRDGIRAARGEKRATDRREAGRSGGS